MNSNAPLSGEAMPVQQVGDQQSERGGQRRRHQRDRERRQERTPRAAGQVQRAVDDLDAERRDVVAQCQRVIQSPLLEESAGENHRVHDDGQHEPRQRQQRGHRTDRSRQRHPLAAVALARNRDEAAAREEPPLDHEHATATAPAGRSRGSPRGRDPAARRRSRNRSRPTALRDCRRAAAGCRSRRGFR